MAGKKITIDIAARPGAYDIDISHGSFSRLGQWAKECLGESASRVFVVSNATVFGLYGDVAVDGLRSAGFDVGVWLMEDGEEHKNLASVENALNAFAEFGLSRTDAVVALGGGVVGDLTGFAASIYLRGITFLQVPTTLLSMIDSSVGGKTGVNSAAGKNRVGSFYQPNGVLIDTDVLRTLPLREITAGFCEAVKHGILAGGELFEKAAGLLQKYPVSGISDHFESVEFRSDLDAFIASQVSFKASIVAADERESTDRIDARSRKILNFGHTLAHALEKVTSYRYFKHGEAVGYGILYAAELSKILALIDGNSVNSLYDVVHRVGVLPSIRDIDPEEVFEAFRFDKKLVGGSLQMILLGGIGDPRIVNGTDIPRSTHIQALNDLMNKT